MCDPCLPPPTADHGSMGRFHGAHNVTVNHKHAVGYVAVILERSGRGGLVLFGSLDPRGVCKFSLRQI